MDENVLFNILSYIPAEHDYSPLFMDTTLKNLEHKRHTKHRLDIFTDLIEETFSSLFYMHFLRIPRTRDEVNQLFATFDDYSTFNDPYYYDFRDYFKKFKQFDMRIQGYDPYKKPPFLPKRQSRTIQALLLAD